MFEFQKAIGDKNFEKAMRIVKYFGDNPKAGPLVFVIGTVFNFFKKLLIFHRSNARDKFEIAKALGVNPFFVTDYQRAAKNYSLGEVKEAIRFLYAYDLKSKGVDSASTDAELLKELTFKLTA